MSWLAGPIIIMKTRREKRDGRGRGKEGQQLSLLPLNTLYLRNEPFSGT